MKLEDNASYEVWGRLYHGMLLIIADNTDWNIFRQCMRKINVDDNIANTILETVVRMHEDVLEF